MQFSASPCPVGSSGGPGFINKKLKMSIFSNFFSTSSLIRSKWKDCLTGHLTGDDLQVKHQTTKRFSTLTKMHQVSANVAQTFAGFAARGQPGFGLPPWTQDQPLYLKIDKVQGVPKKRTNKNDQTLQACQHSKVVRNGQPRCFWPFGPIWTISNKK